MSPSQDTSQRPGPSPLADHTAPTSPRAISFAASVSSPVPRPTTSSSRNAGEGFGKEAPRRESEGGATTTSLWTDSHEDRLVLVQSELKKAQKRWSASQEIWLDEEHRLLEVKQLHKRKLKNEQASVKKAAGIWKSKTWGSRIGSLRSSRKNSAVNVHEGGEGQKSQSTGDETDPEDTDSDGSEDAAGQEVIYLFAPLSPPETSLVPSSPLSHPH
ncbi:MAG: hypothetical protein Q9163_005782 [Psora crenata]